MAYATQQDLIDWCGVNGEDEIIQLTDPANVSIDSMLVAKKLQQADHEVNARLVGVDLPMSAPYPPLLVITACKIARAILYTHQRPERVEQDYHEAIEFLGLVRDGKATLGLAGTGTEAIAPTPKVAVYTPATDFTDEVLAKL